MEDTATQSNPEPTARQENHDVRVALLVEYCGKGFHGNQFQPGFMTIQQAMQEAIAALNLSASAVSFAGRTDAGVHAQGQVAHFDTNRQALANVPNLAAALNAMLPESIAVRDFALTNRDFNSRRTATCKWYRYTIHNAGNRSVWASRQAAAHHRTPLDADRMRAAARLILGTHDFASFKDSDTVVTDHLCTVRHADVRRDGDTIVFDIVADRFLYKMVRNLAGQLMAIGNAECPLPPETILTVLAAGDRTRAAATARPDGLALMAIQYPEPYNFFASNPSVQKLNQQLKKLLSPATDLESLHHDHENLRRKAS